MGRSGFSPAKPTESKDTLLLRSILAENKVSLLKVIGAAERNEGSATARLGVRDFEIHWISSGFRISEWISGFQSGFLDFWISVWISADGVRDFFRDGPLVRIHAVAGLFTMQWDSRTPF